MRHLIFMTSIFFSASVYATPECDNYAKLYSEYYLSTLPAKLENAAADQLTQTVTTERKKAGEELKNFDKLCIWPLMVEAKETPNKYSETYRLLLNAESYLIAFRISRNHDEAKIMLGHYCKFVSKGLMNSQKCITKSSPQ